MQGREGPRPRDHTGPFGDRSGGQKTARSLVARGRPTGVRGPVRRGRGLAGWRAGDRAARDGRCGVAGGERGAERSRVQCVRAKRTLGSVSGQHLTCALPGIGFEGFKSWILRTCHSAALRDRITASPDAVPRRATPFRALKGMEGQKCSESPKLKKRWKLFCCGRGWGWGLITREDRTFETLTFVEPPLL